MRYIHLYLPPRPPEKLWLIGAFLLPFLTAVAIGLFLLVALGDLVFTNMIAATSGIILGIVCVLVFAFFNNKRHKAANPFQEL
jgi:hypothetical protein